MVQKSTEADRLALAQMFKSIAEYGRKIRQRRQAESEPTDPQEQEHPTPDLPQQSQSCGLAHDFTHEKNS
jgi:hypothetical protein